MRVFCDARRDLCNRTVGAGIYVTELSVPGLHFARKNYVSELTECVCSASD